MNKQQNNLSTEELSDEVVISVKNVSKKFCKNLRRSMAYGIVDLSKNLLGIKSDTSTLRKDEFWAIKDVNFELRRGEVLGLIGINGSGKSTLLRLLTGIFPPDKGEIAIKGRIGGLIAVGAGFHPHLSGRENIYLNGTIQGMIRKEIDSKFKDIINFSEIGEFLDAPVSTYSSGMRVRLGFAIAVHMVPDIMLIDEVLAVGDFMFRQKCSEKINEIRKNSAIMLVSHNMRDILMVCSKTIVLNNGEVVFYGVSKDAVDYYLDMVNIREVKDVEPKMLEEDTRSINYINNIYGKMFHNKRKITNVRHCWVNESGRKIGSIDRGTTITLEFSFTLLAPVNNLIIGIPIFKGSNMITSVNTDAENIKITINEDGTLRGKLIIEDLNLNPGEYKSIFIVVDSKEYLYREFINVFQVKEIPIYYGIITFKHKWDLIKN